MERLVAHLRGPAALKFLHNVSAQDLASLTAGQGALAAFLDDRGRLLAFGRVLVGENEAFILADPLCAEGIERSVARVAPLAGVDVDVEVRTSFRVDDPTESDPYSWRREGETIVVAPGWGEVGTEVIGPDSGSSIDDFTLEVARVAAGLPKFGVDVTADTLVNETPLLVHAVSLSKGCYPGQETVARVFNLGQVKRKLRVVEQIDGALTIGQKESLEVTSVAGIAALVRMSSTIEPGSEVDIATARVRVTDTGW